MFSTIISTAVLLLASQAVAAPAASQEVTARDDDVSARGEVGILIATDPYFACNCPNNCSHKNGSGCKYYKNYSNSGPVATGKCGWQGDHLYCYA